MRRKEVLVVLGSGGVGKTTVAAAVALLSASCHRKTLVMTIDPARRLGDTLGLASLGGQEREVSGDHNSRIGLKGGFFYAMMLDQRRTFDEVIHRHCDDAETIEKIQDNKLYRELSTRLAGGQEYAALEKLHELKSSGRYDLLVLDTPPVENALEFLESPKKMLDLLDGAAVRLLIRSHQQEGRLSFKLLGFGARFIFKRLAQFVGAAFLNDLASFFAQMHTLLPEFRKSAVEVAELFSDPRLSFIVVTTPDDKELGQALALAERLRARKYHLGGFIVNRVHKRRNPAPEKRIIMKALTSAGVDDKLVPRLAAALEEAHLRIEALAEADHLALAKIRNSLKDGEICLEIPFFDREIQDLEGLSLVKDSLNR